MEKIIKAVTNCTIGTRIDRVSLSQGEIAKVKFCTESEFKEHLKSGFFVEWHELPTTFEIPVVNVPTPYLVNIVEPIVQQEFTVVKDKLKIETEQPVVDTSEDVVLYETITFLNKESTSADVVFNVNSELDELDEEDKQALIERENAKGRPFKCMKPGCDRLRKKDSLYCKVCQDM